MTQNDKDFIEKIRAGKITARDTADYIEAQYRVIDLLEQQVATLRGYQPKQEAHLVHLKEGLS